MKMECTSRPRWCLRRGKNSSYKGTGDAEVQESKREDGDKNFEFPVSSFGKYVMLPSLEGS